MKFYFCILLNLSLCLHLQAQKLTLRIESSLQKENRVIDSIGYKKKFENALSLLNETKLFEEKLLRQGYLEVQSLDFKKENDSIFVFNFSLGKKTKSLHIYIGDTIFQKIPLVEAENFLNETVKKWEIKGFSLVQVRLTNFRAQEDILATNLEIDLGNKRILSEIVIEGYSKFPKTHLKNLQKNYQKQNFNQNNIDKLSKDITNYKFVTQTQAPQILFTKDSTKIYVYLEKAKANRFEGFIGFTNQESEKINFNGYLDLLLHNILNSGEQFNLYWKNDGNEQTTFNAGLQIPYLFNSSLGLKTDLQLFKQDSTFQNTRTKIDIGYLFNYNTRFYLGYQTTESSDIQNSNSSLISDFKNTFYTSEFEYRKRTPEDILFPEKSTFIFKLGLGERNSKLMSENQFFSQLDLQHHFYLNDRNNVQVKSQSFYLKSENFLVNELYRFGGINSIRGFNENSLQGNFFSCLLTEYRYILSRELYLHSIVDYGYFQDQTNNTEDGLLGLGFGFGLLTKNGFFNLVYANGSLRNQEIKLSNSIVQISFKTRF